MILPRLQKLQSTLEDLAQLETVKQHLEQLDPIARDVNDWACELSDRVAQFRLFADRGLLNGTVIPDPSRLVKAIAQSKTRMAADPLKITAERGLLSLKTAATAVLDEYKRRTDDAWSEWKKGFPRIDDAELREFEAQDSTVCQQIRTIRDQLTKSIRVPARTTEEIEQAEARAATLRELCQRFLAAPPEVKAFLNAANTREGAPLDLFTPAVREWLQQANELEKIRVIRLKRSS